MHTYTIIVAYCKVGRAIGKEGRLPWSRLQGDLPRFKKLTTGNTIIMGRNTWSSIGSTPLPGRKNIVISTQLKSVPPISADGPFIFPNLEESLKFSNNLSNETFFIGGERIYKEALRLNLVDQIIASVVHQEYEGDAFFPKLDSSWELSLSSECNGYNLEIYYGTNQIIPGENKQS